VATCVRYKSSPRHLAGKLVGASAARQRRLILEHRNGHCTYMQTGTSRAQLAAGVREAARRLACARPFPSWEALEVAIAKEVGDKKKKKNNNNNNKIYIYIYIPAILYSLI